LTEINGVSLPFLPAGGIKELQRESIKRPNKVTSISFKEVFEDELQKIKFSAHAKKRLTSRQIELDENDIQRLNNAFQKAEAKGVSESLIILDDKAFIVNIPNQTVVTVVDKSKLSETVFTNIDSAVIA